MLFAKALCVVFVLSLTNFGESQNLNNYDNSTVMSVLPRMIHKSENQQQSQSQEQPQNQQQLQNQQQPQNQQQQQQQQIIKDDEGSK